MHLVKPRILHLEDETGWTRKVKQYLGDKYEIVATQYLGDAIELLNEKDFHLAIVDISLVPQEGSDTGGFQFVSYLHSSDLWIDLPVIVLTAYDSTERMRSAFKEYKVFDFLAKGSIDRQTIQTLVAHAIATGPQSRELGETPRVLVVEDDPQWQSRIKRALEEEGCEVDIAKDYREAIDKVTDKIYHLATIDIRLNDLDPSDYRGEEFIERARSLHRPIDIIVISAYGNAEQVWKAAFQYQAQDFIDKGKFRSLHLRRRVRSILSRLLYITVHIDAEGNTNRPILKLKKEYTLQVSVSHARSLDGVAYSFTRPVTAGWFELEVMVPAFDLEEILPGERQFLKVMSNDTAEPIYFKFLPKEVGRIEITVEFRYRDNLLGQMLIIGETVE